MPSHLDGRVDGMVRVMIVSGTACSSLSSLILKIKILAEGKKCSTILNHRQELVIPETS